MKIENNTFLLKTLIAATICYLGILSPGRAGTYTWNGTGNDWFQDANWDGDTGYPGDGDTATIGSGTLTLTNQTGYLSSLTVTGGTVTFTNWATCLRATDIVISGGTLTLPPAFTDAQMSNRVYVICSNFTLGASATIDVDSKGFAAGQVENTPSYGEGAPAVSGHYGAGAGYGGIGGSGDSGPTPGGPIYGETNAPIAPGSGGGGNSDNGHGGGAVRIEAAGTVTIDGTITAKGGNCTSHGGAGSGGGIFISCAQFAGAASAELRADGGNSAVLSTSHGGSGGGGRIAVAVGVSAADVQKLIDGDPVANVFTSDRHGGYLGAHSVIGGAPTAPTGAHDHTGADGTFRFVTTSSGSTFWLLVNGDPGDHDSPAPYGYGINASFASGTRVTNTVTSPFDNGGGVGWGCLGWSVTNQAGSPVASGSDTQAVFDMTTNMVLTFAWTNMYQLTVTSAIPAQGSVNPGTGEGWYTNGAAVSGISASPAGGYVFNRWTGTGVPAGQETDNPLATTMTEPRLLVAHFSVVGGETKTWNGTGYWTETGNWTPNGIPGPLDDATIASGTVTLHEPHTAASLTVNNGTTMVFTNWNAMLTASNVTVAGEVTLPPAFSESDMSNRVHFVCTNFNLQSSGLVDANARGFRGSLTATDDGEGPGAGEITTSYYGGGAGHGGAGADGGSGAGGQTYGVTNAPLAPGSGGGGNLAGHGGGAVRIDASGGVTIDGTIDASGSNHNSGHGGGGSGGSIFISCDTFQGAATGELLAEGGDGFYNSATSSGGGAGGGRIAVAVGMSAADLQKLIDNQPVSDLLVLSAHPDYAGDLSVTNGWSANASGIPQARPGDMGTARFLQVASGLTLIVEGDPGEYDTPTPYAYGTHPSVDAGASVTNTVTSPFDEGGGVGWGCIGWSVTNALGATVASGSDNQAVFDMTTNLVLTFNWTNLYQLAVTSAIPAQGSVNPGPGEGWYTNGTAVSGISASPEGGYVFNRWTGTGVPAGQETDNPLATTMTEPRLLVAHFAVVGGETKTWNGTGNWTETGNWTPIGIPGAEDSTHIASGTVTLSEPMSVGSLIVSNGTTMVFTNWNTKLTASGAVTIRGEVALSSPFTETDMSNRVHFVCRDFTLASGGLIDAAAMGFSGGYGIGIDGEGPGKGLATAYYGGGAGYGGSGGDGQEGAGGQIYGMTNAPIAPGSGGGGNLAGHGGGAVRIDASGAVTIDGTIDASGGNSRLGGGGGSGGGIFISSRTFDGAASGVLRADGGDGVLGRSGGGGGGRIAVAIGMNASDLERLSQDLTLLGMSVSETHPPYAGNLSVTNGWSGTSPPSRPGEPGTIRIMVAPIRGSLIMLK